MQVLVCINNNSIKHWSFIYTELNNLAALSFNNSVLHRSFVCTQFQCQTVVFEPRIKKLSDVTSPDESGLGSDERAPCIHQSSCITGASASDCFISYPGHLFRVKFREPVGVFYSPSRRPEDTCWGRLSYPSAKMQSVYSVAPTDWVTGHLLGEGVLPLCKDAVGVFYSPR